MITYLAINNTHLAFAQTADQIAPPEIESAADTSESSLFCGRPLSSFAHVINGTSADDILIGTNEDDLMQGFAGNDKMYGNGGNDCLKGGEGDDQIWGGEGNDYIMGLGGDDKLIGDAGNDTVFGGNGNDSIWGNAGNDKLVGEAGNDEIHGDAGDDAVYGNAGEDYLWGGPDNDTLVGGSDNDKLVGDGGNDKMWGGGDTLYDNAGDDVLNGWDGFDKCYDNTGTNTFFSCEPTDTQGDSTKGADFDIKSFTRDSSGNLIMQIYGQAGATVPEKPAPGQFGQVFVYVFNTDNGIWVINAHWECHIGLTCDPAETHVSEWHAEEVSVGHVDGYSNICVTGISNERPATVDANTGKISVPEASKILSVQTAAFDIKTNPDAPMQTCIAELSEVFDEAA